MSEAEIISDNKEVKTPMKVKIGNKIVSIDYTVLCLSIGHGIGWGLIALSVLLMAKGL